MITIKKVVSACCDPNERYFWIIFNNNGTPHSLVYDSKNEELFNWRISIKDRNLYDEVDRYIDNSGDILSLYPVEKNDIVHCWFIANKENAVKDIEKAIINSII